MKILDNITSTVRDDLRVEIKKGSKVSIAAACFSMYAYKELKKQLESVDEFRFIFTSPTFVKEKAEKQKREFYIPRLSRETSLYGTEFEIKLRNEMTQRAIAKECADWIRKKAKFKSNTTGENMAGFMTVDSKTAQTAYMPINGFTTVDIGCERGNNSYNMVNCMEAPFAQQYMQLFDGLWNDREKMQDVTDMVLENISTAYAENSPEFIYFMTLYHVTGFFFARGDIYEDAAHHNAVFVGRDEDGIPRYAHSKGTAGNFRLDVKGSDKAFNFCYRGEGDRLFVFEAPVDLLSFLCLFKKAWQKQSYLSLGGVGEKALLRFLSDRPNIKTVYLCLDSDQAGNDACSRLAELVPEGLTVHRLVPLFKDWNEVLQHRAEITDGKYIREAVYGLKEPPQEETVEIIRMSEVDTQTVEWLFIS